MTLKQFADKWLPAISGTTPKDMMTVKVAFPFEWNCYESWNVVFRVRFDFTDVLARREHGQGTLTDIMNGQDCLPVARPGSLRDCLSWARSARLLERQGPL